MAGVEGKEKRVQHCARTAMDFDPTLKTLRNQKVFNEYLVQYVIRLPSNIKVEWCPPDTGYT